MKKLIYSISIVTGIVFIILVGFGYEFSAKSLTERPAKPVAATDVTRYCVNKVTYITMPRERFSSVELDSNSKIVPCTM